MEKGKANTLLIVDSTCYPKREQPNPKKRKAEGLKVVKLTLRSKIMFLLVTAWLYSVYTDVLVSGQPVHWGTFQGSSMENLPPNAMEHTPFSPPSQ
jgi:hypothetical protein